MGKKLGILVRNELGLDFNEFFKELIDRGVEVVFQPLNHTDDDKIVAEKAKGFDYVIAGRENWSRYALESCADTLKFIARFGVGYNSLDLEAATECGIAIANAPGQNSRSVAEHAVALMFSMMRNITAYDREMKAGPCKARLSQSVEGRLGFLGYGNIAQHVSRMLQPFDVEMIAYDLYPNMPMAEKYGVRMTTLDEVIETSDIISLHLPLFDDTRNIINKDSIARMKDGVFLVNTARGELVNEDDLYDACKSGKIRAAALDAFCNEEKFCKEPHKLKTLDNIIVTPHAGAVSTQGVGDVFKFCRDIVLAFDKGEEVRYILNKDYIKNVK